jgi:hypothetical protein
LLWKKSIIFSKEDSIIVSCIFYGDGVVVDYSYIDSLCKWMTHSLCQKQFISISLYYIFNRKYFNSHFLRILIYLTKLLFLKKILQNHFNQTRVSVGLPLTNTNAIAELRDSIIQRLYFNRTIAIIPYKKLVNVSYLLNIWSIEIPNNE